MVFIIYPVHDFDKTGWEQVQVLYSYHVLLRYYYDDGVLTYCLSLSLVFILLLR